MVKRAKLVKLVDMMVTTMHGVIPPMVTGTTAAPGNVGITRTLDMTGVNLAVPGVTVRERPSHTHGGLSKMRNVRVSVLMMTVALTTMPGVTRKVEGGITAVHPNVTSMGIPMTGVQLVGTKANGNIADVRLWSIPSLLLVKLVGPITSAISMDTATLGATLTTITIGTTAALVSVASMDQVTATTGVHLVQNGVNAQ